MSFVQATTGAGGWPMSVWLTPDLKPFYGGTYFPPESRYNRPGFVEVLQAIARAWRDERERIELSGGRARAAHARGGRRPVPAAPPRRRRTCWRSASRRSRRRTTRATAASAARRSFRGPASCCSCCASTRARTSPCRATWRCTPCARWRLGGMRDHVGGGFHRYSVDDAWRVPHFEKMLYDQAQLVLAYLEAAQATGDRFFAQVAEDTLQYVGARADASGRRLLLGRGRRQPAAGRRGRRPQGRRRVLRVERRRAPRRLLGDDAEVVAARFGVEEDGNAPFDPHGRVHRQEPALHGGVGGRHRRARTGRTADEVVDALGRARLALFAARLSRPRPHLDDKVLAAWNGLMIAAFARGARVLRAPALRPGGHGRRPPGHRATRRALRPRPAVGRRRGTCCWRRFRDGEAAVDGYAEDYAAAAFGLLELFQADGDPEWLAWADQLQTHPRRSGSTIPIDGGWFSTTGAGPDGADPVQGRLRRRRAVADGAGAAEPAGADASAARRRSHGAHQRSRSPGSARAWASTRAPCRWC